MKHRNFNNVMDKISKRIKENKFNTGLVLSGGAARGFAHGGALKALEEKEIKADIISGVSAGAIVGSFYCDGFAPEEILEIFQKNKIFEFIKVTFKKQGLLNITGLKKVLEKNLRTKKIENLQTPLIIAATNLKEGVPTYFSEGNLVDHIIASSSIPVLFKPAVIDGITYVDGGVTNNFPVEPLIDKCNKLIGVHVNPLGPYEPDKGLLHIAINAFHMSIASGIEEKRKLLDYFIEPKKLHDYTYYDVKGGREMFDIGYDETIKVMRKEA